MKRLSLSSVTLIQLVLNASVSAHPGHGPGEVPSAHLVTSIDHLGALLIVGVIGFCLFNVRRWLNRNSKV
jgi:hydrogenase/urease accessory protein HupE